MKELYSELILDLSKNPKNFGKIEHNRSAEGNNAVCGDKVEIYLLVKDEIIEKASFVGKGCAISTASNSAITRMLEGKSVTKALDLADNFMLMLRSEKYDNQQIKYLKAFEGIKNYPSRVKCATLGWHALRDALS